MSANPYDNPAQFGLELIDWIDQGEPYEFDIVAVWRRVSDGRFVWAADAGCSCPSPFEDTGVEDLQVLLKRGGLAKLREAIGATGPTVTPNQAEFIEKLHAAGLR